VAKVIVLFYLQRVEAFHGFALFPLKAREGRIAQRIRGESAMREALAQVLLVHFTHPVVASLDHPLSGKPERG
jgi:hypothetical protein